MMIYVYYTRFNKALPARRFEQLLRTLPIEIQAKIQRFVRWQDAHACLFGKLLLVHALQVTGWAHLSLDQLQYKCFNRPYFDEALDFKLVTEWSATRRDGS